MQRHYTTLPSRGPQAAAREVHRRQLLRSAQVSSFRCALNKKVAVCFRRPSPGASPHRTEVMDDVARAPQVEGGGAKKHRRLPSGRLQRQNSPSGEGWASLNGTASYIDGPMPASGPWMITYPSPVIMTRSFGTT